MQRNELVNLANTLGFDASTIVNDSKLEAHLKYLQANQATINGTLGTQTLTTTGTFSAGETITIGDVVYTMRSSLTGAKATAVLTGSDVFSNGETIQIGNVTYTMRTALTSGGQPFEVLIGASLAASLDNLKVAINAGTGAGTEYGSGTYAHPQVTATTNTNTEQTVEARDYGTSFNKLPVSEQCANASWGAATLANGAATVPNEVLIGANAAASLDNLKSAINDSGTEGTHYSVGTGAHPQVTATTNADDSQVVQARDMAVTNAKVGTTTTAANATWGSTALASGVADQNAVDATAVAQAGKGQNANV